jgi:hypothetical protein
VYIRIRSGSENVEAAQVPGEQIEEVVNSVSLTAIQQKGLADQNQQALVNAYDGHSLIFEPREGA